MGTNKGDEGPSEDVQKDREMTDIDMARLDQLRELAEAIGDQLVDQNGRSRLPFLVLWNDQVWMQNPNARWPEVLGYRLAGFWLNIPETIPGVQATGAVRLTGGALPTTAAPLIRIGQTLARTDLPIRDLDEAIAGELAYSVWIRRRDPSAWNRVYVDGVPLFFDHHIAFGTEPDHQALAGFLAHGPDGGYAGQWRLRELGQDEVPTTMGERALPRHIAVHRVRSCDAFDRHLDNAVRRILRVTNLELNYAVRSAGAPAIVASWLAYWRDELPEGVQRLRPILDRAD